MMNTEHTEHTEIARLIGDLRRAERERDALAAQRDAARADHAAAEAHLAAIVRVWQRASDEDRRMADVFVTGLRREIEEARDGREGDWWEVSRG